MWGGICTRTERGVTCYEFARYSQCALKRHNCVIFDSKNCYSCDVTTSRTCQRFCAFLSWILYFTSFYLNSHHEKILSFEWAQNIGGSLPYKNSYLTKLSPTPLQFPIQNWALTEKSKKNVAFSAKVYAQYFFFKPILLPSQCEICFGDLAYRFYHSAPLLTSLGRISHPCAIKPALPVTDFGLGCGAGAGSAGVWPPQWAC